MNKDVTSEIKNQTGIITINTADGLNVINRMMLSDIAETITAMDLPTTPSKPLSFAAATRLFDRDRR